MAMPMMCYSFVKLSRSFMTHSRVLLLRPTQHVGAVEQTCCLSSDHPGMPKRPSPSYILFVTEKRPEVVEENPYLSNVDAMKSLAAMWRDLPEIEKENYRSIAKTNFERYHEEMEDFKASITKESWEEIELQKKERIETKHQQKIKRERKKLLKDLGKPKSPGSVLSVFVKETNRNSDSKQSIQEVTKIWNTLSDEEKEVYKNKLKESQAAYKVDIEEWKTKMIAEGHEDLVTVPGKKKKESTKNPKRTSIEE